MNPYYLECLIYTISFTHDPVIDYPHILMKKLSFREVFQSMCLGHLLAHHLEDIPDLEAFPCPVMYMPICTPSARSVDSHRPLWASNPQPRRLPGPGPVQVRAAALASPDSRRPAYCQLLGQVPPQVPRSVSTPAPCAVPSQRRKIWAQLVGD